MALFPWQAEVLDVSARTVGGHWASFENVAIVPRQNGKSYLIVARALAGALLYDERLILYSAHEYRTAQEVFRTLRDLCESDEVAPYVKAIRISPSHESVEFTTGCRLQVIARTRTAGRGFSPDCLLLDEAFALNPDVIASVIPALSARPNPQVYYFSSAGTWQSEVLLGLRRKGHAGTGSRFAYWEWHADETCDIRDPRVWAATNPAYGLRLSRMSIENELETMSRRSFLRERLGVWSESMTETVFDSDVVQKLTVPSPPPPTDGRPVGWGLDVAWDRTGAAICAAFRKDDGRPVLVLVDARPGAGWVVDRMGELEALYGPDGWAYDHRGGIVDIVDRAEREHVIRPIPLKHSEYPAACAGLAQRVSERSVRFGDAPMLIADANAASSARMTSGWVWDRKVTTPPTHLIAATCALYALDHNDGGSSVAVY
jgi:phage terminase large subunit-like protein